jgi:hypothetical protein
MQQHFQDAMAIVRRHGKPTFFITMTTNPKWPEIVQELEEGQTSADRPDITARVFAQKQDAFVKDIESGILGKLKAHVHTLEFQKRGLPHTHFLFIMAEENQTWQDIDESVCAEIPDPNSDVTKDLYELVIKHMVHGPCGKSFIPLHEEWSVLKGISQTLL